MTKEWYKQNGFELSAYIDDATIARAEADVTAAYIKPIYGGDDDDVKKAVGVLAFMLILQRSIFATRAGAKLKTGFNSVAADEWQILSNCATAAHLALVTLRGKAGANKDAEILDICKIYFKTNFFSL